MDSERLPQWTLSVKECGEGAVSVIRLAEIDARDPAGGQTFIAAQGFGAQIEPFEMLRFALIAHRLRARILVVETPGFGPAGSGLLKDERRALRAGDFSPLAKRMLNATDHLTNGIGHRRLSFLGYSLGSSLVAAMAAVATSEGWTVDELLLVEPVGLRGWTLPRLLNAALRERRSEAEYLSMNIGSAVESNTYDPDNKGLHANHSLDQLRFGVALLSGGLPRQLLSISSALSHVTVVWADRSALTGPSTTRFVAALRASGVPVSELIVPGHHGFWHSLSLVVAMTDRLENLCKPARSR